MANNPRLSILIPLLFLIILIFFVDDGVWAFGAGNIPSFAYMEGRAFRHGDIEDVLADLVKKSGFLRPSKFGGLDIKRVYFGNWLRDYSQAVDIAGLKKLPVQTIINLCMVLGFLANGYATGEFEVTAERLGVYLPTEHIDNPKGYGDGEDARKYHPKLRGPVDPRELEVDPNTGMKNYIANEHGSWDTSKGLVRRTLERCIQIGRQSRNSNNKADEHEAYRLLGQALHTLEDFSAHSNFCELALVNLGHRDVFCHVGDQVRIRAPNNRMVAPLVTGTFGGSDFTFSLLGEATDHISQASVSDLNKEMEKARSANSRGLGSPSLLQSLFLQIPGIGSPELSREMEGIERLRSGEQGGKRPEEMSPEELHATLWQILKFRDGIMMQIESTIEKIPGLSALVEKLTSTIAVFVYTTIEPFLKPLLQTATTQLASTSADVINSHDQEEVFHIPHASDPTHSFLSKDHFNLILNEPAGNLAKIIVKHTVTLVTRAWDDASINPHDSIENALQSLFHPDFHNSGSTIQREMLQYMSQWITSQGSQQQSVLSRLTKDSVRNHLAVRAGGGPDAYVHGAGHDAGVQAQSDISSYISQLPGVAQAQGLFGGGAGARKDLDPPQIINAGPYGHSPAVQQPSSYPNVPQQGYHAPQHNAPQSGYPGASHGHPSPGSYRPQSQSQPSYPQQPTYPGSAPSPSLGVSHQALPSFPSFPGASPQQPSHYGASPQPAFPSPGGHHPTKKHDDSSDSDSSDDGKYGKPKKEKKHKDKKDKKEKYKNTGSVAAPAGFPSPSGAPPSFPGSFPGSAGGGYNNPSYPPTEHYAGGYNAPPGPPSGFPSYNAPSGPPSFPGGPSYGPPQGQGPPNQFPPGPGYPGQGGQNQGYYGQQPQQPPYGGGGGYQGW